MTAWDVTTRRPIYRRTIGSLHSKMTVSPDRQLLALPQGDEKLPGGQSVRIEDLETGEYRQSLPSVPQMTTPLAFSPDSWLLVTSTYAMIQKGGTADLAHTLKVWEVATAEAVLSLPTVPNVLVAFSPDGRLLACLPRR